MPLDVRHDNEGAPAAHPACHNVYGMQMHRATKEGLLRARPDQRPFTMTRATYAGENADAIRRQGTATFGKGMVLHIVEDDIVMLVTTGEIFFGVIDHAICA